MSESQKVARINITMPAALKQRMDAVSEDVNWSATAAEAFERKLLALASQREARSMKETIERLKAAKELEQDKSHRSGHEAGEKWAMNVAKPSELQRLEEYGDESQHSWEYDLEVMNNSRNDGAGTVLAKVITGDDELDREGVESFWIQCMREPGDFADTTFALGFVEGALQVWAAVKDHI
jgi:hypothetical protein